MTVVYHVDVAALLTRLFLDPCVSWQNAAYINNQIYKLCASMRSCLGLG
jgi:hypothetical protein